MKKEIYLHVPEPCHENWEAMTPLQQGRFCESCSKQVVDFSRMTDKQILDVLSKAAGKTCGRFSTGQLERPIAKEIPYLLKPYKLFFSAFIPGFILANSGLLKAQGTVGVKTETTVLVNAQDTTNLKNIVRKKITGSVKDEGGLPVTGASVSIKGTSMATSSGREGEFQINYPEGQKKMTLVIKSVGFSYAEVEVQQNDVRPIEVKLESMMAGEVVVVGNYRYDDWNDGTFVPAPKRKVLGRVINEAGEPVPYASVKCNTGKGVIADSNGLFSIQVRADKKKLHFSVSSVGHEDGDSLVELFQIKKETINITLKRRSALHEVVVKCFPDQYLTALAGGLSVVRTVTIKDTAKTLIQKAFNNEMFKAYPNPIPKGNEVKLYFKKEGEYSIQVFDNAGKLYLQKELTIAGSKQLFPLALPQIMSAGIYYLKAVNTSTQKQFVDKIIVQ